MEYEKWRQATIAESEDVWCIRNGEAAGEEDEDLHARVRCELVVMLGKAIPCEQKIETDNDVRRIEERLRGCGVVRPRKTDRYCCDFPC